MRILAIIVFLAVVIYVIPFGAIFGEIDDDQPYDDPVLEGLRQTRYGIQTAVAPTPEETLFVNYQIGTITFDQFDTMVDEMAVPMGTEQTLYSMPSSGLIPMQVTVKNFAVNRTKAGCDAVDSFRYAICAEDYKPVLFDIEVSIPTDAPIPQDRFSRV